VMAVVFTLFGFMLGSFGAHKVLIVMLFFGTFILSYWAHKKGYVEFFKTSGYIK
jgi:hypothetical protein